MTPLHNGCFWVDPPDVRVPWGLRLAFLLGVLVWALAFVGVKSLFGQVPVILEFRSGLAETTIQNAGHERSRVTITLWKSLTDTTPPAALIAPHAFDLEPGDWQKVRVLLHENCNPAFRWATTFLPDDSGRVALRQGLATIRLKTAVRIVGRVACS